MFVKYKMRPISIVALTIAVVGMLILIGGIVYTVTAKVEQECATAADTACLDAAKKVRNGYIVCTVAAFVLGLGVVMLFISAWKEPTVYAAKFSFKGLKRKLGFGGKKAPAAIDARRAAAHEYKEEFLKAYETGATSADDLVPGLQPCMRMLDDKTRPQIEEWVKDTEDKIQKAPQKAEEFKYNIANSCTNWAKALGEDISISSYKRVDVPEVDTVSPLPSHPAPPPQLTPPLT